MTWGWMDMINSAISVSAMENSIHDDPMLFNFKKHAMISGTHPLFWMVIAQMLHISTKILLKPTQALNDPQSIFRMQVSEVFFSLRFEFD
jgi:hypothetical protein